MSDRAEETPLEEVFHDRTPDGRQKHYMVRQGPLYVCECGERRDRFGNPLPQLKVVSG